MAFQKTSIGLANLSGGGTPLNTKTCAELNDTTTGLTSAQRQVIQMVEPLKTGQTTSYRTGDDGDLEDGRLVDFFTLSCNNPFGNTNRFTDQSGGQTYSDDIVCDWATRIMWYRITGTNTWFTSIDNGLALGVGGYSGWHLPNMAELMSICNYELSVVLDYAPMNMSFANYWVSTTAAGATANAYILRNNVTLASNGQWLQLGKSTTTGRVYCRQFTYSGGSFS